MELADIVISVDLPGYTGNDYAALEKIIPKGYEAADGNSSVLARLAVNEPDWQQYEAARESRRIRSVPTPDLSRYWDQAFPVARH